MIEKPAVTDHPIEEIIAERWSGRAFDKAIPVSPNQVDAMCEAARWAPSCYGDQPWRFVIWDRFADKENWEKALACLSPGNQDWAQNAPILILATSEQAFSHNQQTNRWAGYDTGAATISLCLQATAMGLMSHQMGGFDAEKLSQTFDLPDSLQLWSMIAVGHPAPLDSLTADQLERELKARERRPLTESFFHNQWRGKR